DRMDPRDRAVWNTGNRLDPPVETPPLRSLHGHRVLPCITSHDRPCRRGIQYPSLISVIPPSGCILGPPGTPRNSRERASLTILTKKNYMIPSRNTRNKDENPGGIFIIDRR